MRLNHKTIRQTGAAISIRFDGRDIPALAGETVAAALSAAGIVAFRRTPGGAPRWLHSAGVLDRIVKTWRDAAPMNRWFDRHVGPSTLAPPEPD